jgi:hypothetical protein
MVRAIWEVCNHRVDFASVANRRLTHGLPGIGAHRWIGEEKPDFHFVSFAPQVCGNEDKVYEALGATRDEAYRLFEDREFVVDLGISTKTKIIVSEGQKSHLHSEIGFEGTKEGVRHAKWLMGKKLGIYRNEAPLSPQARQRVTSKKLVFGWRGIQVVIQM